MNQKKETSEIIHPMYRPDPKKEVKTPQEIEQEWEKKVAENQGPWIQPKAYNQFTKKFDLTINSIGFRK